MAMRKLRIGSPHLFIWRPAMALAAPTAASLSIYWPLATQTYALTIRGNDTVAAPTGDRRRLAVTFGASGILADFLDGAPLHAHLSADSYGQIPVRVTRLVSSVNNVAPIEDTGVLELADPLSEDVTNGGTLRWLTGSATISAAHLPASPTRAIKFEVAYTPKIGGETAAAVVESGVLAVVRDVFATGLTDGEASARAPWLRSAISDSSVSLAEFIETGESTLISAMRAHEKMPADTWEDQLSGPQFLRAHVLAVELAVCDDMIARGIDRSARREQAEKDFYRELARVFARFEWVDANNDGAVNAGDSDSPAYVPGVSTGTGNANLTDIDDPTGAVEMTRYGVQDPR